MPRWLFCALSFENQQFRSDMKSSLFPWYAVTSSIWSLPWHLSSWKFHDWSPRTITQEHLHGCIATEAVSRNRAKTKTGVVSSRVQDRNWVRIVEKLSIAIVLSMVNTRISSMMVTPRKETAVPIIYWHDKSQARMQILSTNRNHAALRYTRPGVTKTEL